MSLNHPPEPEHPMTSTLNAPPTLGRLRLRRKTSAEPESATEQSTRDAQRERITKGLNELRGVHTREAYAAAIEVGVAFSTTGFQTRVSVGPNTLRVIHKDLFDELIRILDYIYPEVLGIPRNKNGPSARPKPKGAPSEKDLRIRELERLLEKREKDYLDLVQELTTLR